MASLPGWMLLFAGAAMVAMVTLVPAWIDCQKLDWQLQVVQTQSSQLLKQQVAYEQFLTAMREHDPVVIERMAYYHLRLKPSGTSMLDDLMLASTTQANGRPSHKVWHTLPTIEDLLSQPIVQPSHTCPPGVIPDSRLVRIATGPQRHLLLGLGVLCLFFGVLPPSQATLAALATGAVATTRTRQDMVADEPNESWQEESGDSGGDSVAELPDEFAAAAAVAERGTAGVHVAAREEATLHVSNVDDQVDDTLPDEPVDAMAQDDELILAELEPGDTEISPLNPEVDQQALAAFLAQEDAMPPEPEEDMADENSSDDELVVAVVDEESPGRIDPPAV